MWMDNFRFLVLTRYVSHLFFYTSDKKKKKKNKNMKTCIRP